MGCLDGDESGAAWGAEVIRGGGCVVWALPTDATCAAFARARVGATMRALRMPDVLVRDAATMVSELATNTYRHAPGTSAELYAYRTGERARIVVKVFDGAPWKGAVRPGPPSSPLDEGGRGFELVKALAWEHGGFWGVHRSRSRLAFAPVAGKAAYFGLPMPGVALPVPRKDPAEAARELEAALGGRGLRPLHRCEGWGMAVLSVRAEITVWARRHGFVVTMPSVGTVRYPLWEVTEVAEAIVRCGEDLDAR
ncbi:ATP-binding protein [Actinomadura physcomitrii]|nr:ATP-binding protein [Actinomadura physcomitrii]